MKKVIFWMACATLTVCFIPLCSVQAKDGKPIEWTFQNTYSGTEWTTTGGIAHLWADIIKKSTQGRLVIKVIPPGGLVSPKDTLKAVSKGTVDAAFHYPGFYTGVIPEANIEMGLPFAWENQAEALDAYVNYGLLKRFREIYKEHNIFWNPTCFGAVYAVMTKFPISSPEDLKGKKMRASGPYADWVKAFGGSPTVISTAELYMAAKLGTIDGAIISGEHLTSSAKLEETMKFAVVSPNPNTIVGNILINMDSLKALPEDIRSFIESSTLSIINYSCIGQAIGEKHSFFHAALHGDG